MTPAVRFSIRRATWARPLLLIFGTTGSRSWVEIREESVCARFGWYRFEVPLKSIRSAGHSTWPWYGGIGWRTNVRSTLGLIGVNDGIVRLVIDPPQPARLVLIPIRVRDLYLSLDDPSSFLTALEERV